MTEMQKNYYDKRGALLVKNLQSRHFEAHYCATKEDALEKTLSLIPAGSTVGWGGAMSAQQIGLLDAVRAGTTILLTGMHVPQQRSGRNACTGA